MTDMSRKYYALAFFVVIIIAALYVVDYMMQQLAVNVKKRHPRPTPRQVTPAPPSQTPTNASAPTVGRRFRWADIFAAPRLSEPSETARNCLRGRTTTIKMCPCFAPRNFST
jgi:hypothetical protein